jgi:hypothetical protein
MKTGKTLTELATELERQQTQKKDFVADTRATEVESIAIEKGPATTTISVADQDFTVGEHAHDQIAARLKIPKKYYDRMREEAPRLLDENINGWFQRQPERRMIRTLDGDARAYLSERYRRLDNYDLAQAVLPVLADLGQGAMRVESAEITSSRFYLKAIFPRVENEVGVGDPVQSGILISNSEIGVGALQISPLIFRLVCKNGLIAADSSMKRYHVGRAGGSEEEAYELFSDKTLKADDAAIFGKVQDLVRAAITGESFAKIVDKMKESTRRGIEGNPVKAVEVLANRLGFSEAEAGGILKHLTGGGSLTQYGLLNAVTRYAQDVASYDRSTELEAAGGLVLELKPSEWQEIAKAA